AGLLDDDGFLLVGNANGVNLLMDDNEIMARNNGAISDLYVQKDGGKVFIGDPVSPSFLLSVNGTAGKNGGGSWSTYSDRRLKDNIRVYSDGLDAILKINPVWFQYNSVSGYDTKTKYVGVIAQELQEVSPYMVTTPAEPLADGSSGYLQVDNSAMTYMLINAVKELHAEIENLKSEIQELRKAK
ncbi:MAG TPA: tail fiber domain-containing protein, partial [Saprospiraceae bacterium]|nr:tail fiber domain-containing protein [Saprospiraceae bacterium]